MLRTSDEIGPLQLMILAALWELGPVTAKALQAELPQSVAYTSVLTVLHRLEAKGLVSHTIPDFGRAFRFAAAISREEAQGLMLRPLVPYAFATYSELRKATIRLENGGAAGKRGADKERLAKP